MGFPLENVLAMYQKLSPFKLQVRGHNLNKKLQTFKDNVYTFFLSDVMQVPEL